jgi:hypothetical protein
MVTPHFARALPDKPQAAQVKPSDWAGFPSRRRGWPAEIA